MSELAVQITNLLRGWYWAVWAGVVLGVLLVPIPVGAAAPIDRTFTVEASRFEYQPAILKVNPGDHVTIELVATDVVHGLAIDGYNLETTADPGQTARLSFTADKSGSFRFHCIVPCGNLHPFMIGKLQVGRNTLLLRSIGLLGLVFVAGLVMIRK